MAKKQNNQILNTKDTAEKLNLIDEAFGELETHKGRFLECERAYKAVYKDHGRNAPLKSTERSRSRLYVPLVKTTIQIIHSIFKTSFMSDRCPIEISRVGMMSDDDLVLANALSAILKNRWKRNEHRVGLSKAVLSALYLPLGITSLYYDRTERVIKTKFIPITDLAFDKHASDINDIEYVAYRWSQSTREVRAKQQSGVYLKNDELELALNKSAERVKMKDIYEKQSGENGSIYWRLLSFANDKLIRTANFARLPFHFGYAIEAMPEIDEDLRAEQSQVYGSCIPEIAKELQAEYNIKRNQKIDITEAAIEPSFIINKNAGQIALNDISMHKKFIRVEANNGQSLGELIQPLVSPSEFGALKDEIAILKDEYEITTGVNSVMTGRTSPSDRRAMGALQVVNASSSMRIESMLQTLMETMLLGYAQHFVELIYRHTSDEEIIKITEDPDIVAKIGDMAFRAQNRLDFDLNIDFGTTISKDQKIGQLNALMQVLAQNNIQSYEITSGLLKEMMSLILGENAPLGLIDEYMAKMQEQEQAAAAAAQQQMAAQALQNEASEQNIAIQAQQMDNAQADRQLSQLGALQELAQGSMAEQTQQDIEQNAAAEVEAIINGEV